MPEVKTPMKSASTSPPAWQKPKSSNYNSRRFNRWLESGEECPNPENYRYHAFVAVDKVHCDFVDQFMEGKSLESDDAVDEQDITLLTVVSRDEEEGEMSVFIPHLLRAGGIIAMQGEGVSWQLLQVPYGGVATSQTEFERPTSRSLDRLTSGSFY
jgi:hypothetical protein